MCTEKSKKLENLSTVMTLYSRRTFRSDIGQGADGIYILYSR